MSAAKPMRAAPVLLIVLALLAPAMTFAADEKTYEEEPGFKTVKTAEGLIFRVPSDMPIVKRDGIQTPLPFDEYIYGKVTKLEARIAALESRLEQTEKEVRRLSR